jgi:hypothetical protein
MATRFAGPPCLQALLGDMCAGMGGPPGPVGQGQRQAALLAAARQAAEARPVGPQDLGQPGSWRFLGNGVYGVVVALRSHWPPPPGLAPTVVLKLGVSVDFDKCLPALDLVCGRKASVPLTDWAWAGAFRASREHAAHGILLKCLQRATCGGGSGACGSPHVVQGVAWGTWTLPGPPQSIVDLLKGLGVQGLPEALDAHKILSRPTARVQWCLQEFAGVGLAPMLKTRLVPACGAAPLDVLRVYQSAALQALVGVLHLHRAGLHHNDLHASNVLGVPVTTRYLYYVVGARGPASPGSSCPTVATPGQLLDLLQPYALRRRSHSLRVLLRVPTWGALWRVGDLGGATSHALHPLDHGMMARVWFGGPRFAARVMAGVAPRAPLHAFDAARLLCALHRNASSALAAPEQAPTRRLVQQWLQRVLDGAQDRAKALARAARKPLVLVSEAGTPPVPVSAQAADEARLLQAVTRTDAACKDVGATRAVLLHAAELAGCVLKAKDVPAALGRDPHWRDNLFFV